MRCFRLFVFILTLNAIAFGVLPAVAQDQSPSDTTALSLKDVDQKIRILARKIELEQEAAAAKAKEAAVLVAGKDGFSLKSADGKYQFKLRGYVQTDGRFFFGDEEKRFVNTFLMRRIRPIFEGTLDKNFSFYMMLDFGGGTTVMQDAYVDFAYLSKTKLRIGKMKEPFGIERLQSGANLLFIERALPNNLVPNRDLGVQLYGDLFKNTATYAIGAFNGVADGGSADTDAGDEKDYVARLFIHPFKNSAKTSLQNFGLGLAYSSGTQQGTAAAPGLPSYRTPAQQTYFSYRSDGTAPNTTIANGKRTRISSQGYFYAGAFGLFGEYVVAEQQVARATNTATLKNDAYQIAASYVISSNAVTYRGVNMPKPFDPKAGSWGALELAARYNKLNTDKDAFPVFANPASAAQSATGWSVGFNWYLNKNAKFTVDYEQTKFEGGAAVGDRKQEKIIFSRLQISY